ncbi:MAG: flagellar hook-associated 2 protein [Firmicutes bacterium]|nr:flagellar hook-associated 2 protein [Bacillota bacterium]
MSTSSITTSTVNGTTRITGLSSGLDVDGIVEQLITAEKAKKLDSLEQDLQTAEWTQEAYRSVISDLTDFEDTYFSTTSSSSIMKASNFLQYTATSSDDAVTVTASSSASAGSHTVSVTALATEATYSNGGTSISLDVQGSEAADYTSLSGESFVISLDGTDYTVDLDSVTDLSSLQSAIDDAVGSDKITVSENASGYLEITAEDDGIQEITVSATSSSDSGLTDLGFGDTAVLSNRLDTSTVTLADLSDYLTSSTDLTFTNSQIALTINGTTLYFDEEDTIDEMMEEVNDADLGVTMEYDELTGEFVLTAEETGAGDSTLTVADSGSGNFASLLLGTYTAGTDAEFSIDGEAYTRSDNSVTIDGVTYTLNALTTTTTTDSSGNVTTTDDPLTVTVTQDTDGIYELIENFVEAYNELIATLNDLVDENSDSDYPPLTDAEKEDMTDEQITAWEAKAQVGLLESDSTIEDLLSDLRTALIDSVSGLTLSLSDIGITTGDYDEEGTLTIDETTLTSAIASDPEAIMELFTQTATSTATTSSVEGDSLGSNSVLRSLNATDLATRYEEEGIAYRFYDLLESVVSTSRDSAGNKGTLIEKAGTESDASESDNTLSSLIEKYEEEIEDEEDRLDELQETLYDKYTTLETYISTMNSQLSALSSLLGSSS